MTIIIFIIHKEEFIESTTLSSMFNVSDVVFFLYFCSGGQLLAN